MVRNHWIGKFDFREKRARKEQGYAEKVFGFSYIGYANYPVADKGATFHEFYAAWWFEKMYFYHCDYYTNSNYKCNSINCI